MNESSEPIHRSDRNVYFTSMLWAIPLCFVLTLVVTAAALLIAQIGEPDFDALGAVFSGVFFGFLIFFPTCFVSIPIVGLIIASIRLFAQASKQRSSR